MTSNVAVRETEDTARLVSDVRRRFGEFWSDRQGYMFPKDLKGPRPVVVLDLRPQLEIALAWDPEFVRDRLMSGGSLGAPDWRGFCAAVCDRRDDLRQAQVGARRGLTAVEVLDMTRREAAVVRGLMLACRLYAEATDMSPERRAELGFREEECEPYSVAELADMRPGSVTWPWVEELAHAHARTARAVVEYLGWGDLLGEEQAVDLA